MHGNYLSLFMSTGIHNNFTITKTTKRPLRGVVTQGTLPKKKLTSRRQEAKYFWKSADVTSPGGINSCGYKGCEAVGALVGFCVLKQGSKLIRDVKG